MPPHMILGEGNRYFGRLADLPGDCQLPPSAHA